MRLEEIAAHYQKTGEFLPEGFEFMVDYFIENIQGMHEEYISEFNEDSVPFQVHVLQRLNDWQIESGFAREYTPEEVEEMIGDDDLDISIGEEDDNDPWIN
jgi:hypothetical protein